MAPTQEKSNASPHDRGIAGGVVLILIGTALLLQRWFAPGYVIVLLLGLGMLVWGSLAHRGSWIIPGGVLTGIGLGILAIEGPWRVSAANRNGVFLVCFSFGWFLIALLSRFFSCTQWWALIPGGIMALIGASVLVLNGTIQWKQLDLVSAAILILIGLVLLLTQGRAKRPD